jgi:hypothetical protein
VTHRYYEIVTAEWARRWPVEDLWVASLEERPQQSTRPASREWPTGTVDVIPTEGIGEP